jgi:tRNA threonylcarbamoyladenosine biosynthesis protein TsaE
VTWKEFVPDENAMMALGMRLAERFTGPGLIYLEGDLGAGKSTLARGFIKGQGYNGHVKSPTYTLVEPYQVADRTIYHMDLYRLSDPEELEFIGIRDLLADDTICLVEWPDKGKGVLPEADLLITIRNDRDGREVSIEALTLSAQNIINEL